MLLGGLLFNYPYNDIDVIEGEGLFNFAKLSGSEIQAARDDANRQITAEYSETNSRILDLLTQSAIAGNKTAHKKLADMYYEGSEDFGMSPDYRKAYIWYYIYGSRTDYDKYSGITSLLAQAVDTICTNIISLGDNEIDIIEGEGLFNFAKLTQTEIKNAQSYAIHIIAEIPAEIREGADRLDGVGSGGSELVSGIVKEVLTELAAHALKTQLIR